MARKITRREYVFVAILLVAGTWALYYSGNTGFGPGRDEKDSAPHKLGQAPTIDLARLVGAAEGYDPEGRSLFKYYTPPKPVAPPVERKPPPRPKPTAPKPKAPPPRPSKPRPAGPKPPVISFTYLGFLGPKDQKIAIFENEQGMMLARAGETVEEQFRLVEFKYESVVLGYTDERFQDNTTELRVRK